MNNLENEIRIKLTDNLTLYNDIVFNNNTDTFSRISSSLGYKDSSLSTTLGHLFQDQPLFGFLITHLITLLYHYIID